MMMHKNRSMNVYKREREGERERESILWCI
jgi:hypothetical protein